MYSGFIYNYPKLEATLKSLKSISWWMDTQTVAHSKKYCSATRNSKPVRRHATARMTLTSFVLSEETRLNSYTLYDSIYMKRWRKQNNNGKKTDSRLSGAGAGGREWWQRGVTCSTSDSGGGGGRGAIACTCFNSLKCTLDRENFTAYALCIKGPD